MSLTSGKLETLNTDLCSAIMRSNVCTLEPHNLPGRNEVEASHGSKPNV
jgi:hypothetical protein